MTQANIYVWFLASHLNCCLSMWHFCVVPRCSEMARKSKWLSPQWLQVISKLGLKTALTGRSGCCEGVFMEGEAQGQTGWFSIFAIHWTRLDMFLLLKAAHLDSRPCCAVVVIFRIRLLEFKIYMNVHKSCFLITQLSESSIWHNHPGSVQFFFQCQLDCSGRLGHRRRGACWLAFVWGEGFQGQRDGTHRHGGTGTRGLDIAFTRMARFVSSKKLIIDIYIYIYTID